MGKRHRRSERSLTTEKAESWSVFVALRRDTRLSVEVAQESRNCHRHASHLQPCLSWFVQLLTLRFLLA